MLEVPILEVGDSCWVGAEQTGPPCGVDTAPEDWNTVIYLCNKNGYQEHVGQSRIFLSPILAMSIYTSRLQSNAYTKYLFLTEDRDTERGWKCGG